MAIQTLNTIKNWFRTGLKPTQTQFWDTWDSFRHKSEKIPVVDIDGLGELLQNKTEIEAFENHLTDTEAHIDLFNSKVEKSQFDAHIIDPVAHEDLFNSKVEKSHFDTHIIDPNAHQDLLNGKEDKSQKGAQNGYAPLNDFTKLASEYLDIVNDVVSGGTTSVLSAEQGKLMQNRIDAINTILTSDNVNLDTVQKLVDAIELVQLSLNSILVNDLTTGGTTKGLTAEMGKLLQTNKVDKVAGERLINAAEITKLSGLTNVTTTVKTILSTALATQNVAGFVAYINALSPVLVVGPNEIVKYTTSDTGRTFELNLRGRSFGVGQPAIVAANVLEITEFLNKDIKLSNYPNTRNDGQLPTNKVLSTDINGNLKMYTIATSPAPYLEILIPDSTLPSTTTNFVLKGAFFTPTMTVTIQGQTINYNTFINDNEVRVNVTTGAVEGLFSVTLDNGISATFSNALMVVLGTVFKPTTSDWENLIQPVDVSGNNILAKTIGSSGSARLALLINSAKKTSIYFSIIKSPLNGSISEKIYNVCKFEDQVNGDIYILRFHEILSTGQAEFQITKNGINTITSGYTYFGWRTGVPANINIRIRFFWDLTSMIIYADNVSIYTVPFGNFVNNTKFTAIAPYSDIIDVRHVTHT
ncbi:hypothetical protein [Flavobacterium sp. MDT1-60]|uniref:hypothetical protein n=1 Tax=Flavobacterium sp. MDT1-60 TaxID=1979344 RepID=UPI00177CDB56|nr:hypothetical protein [Flavobacterium sp. MDT1-60]QOG04348.1 hypothetical protein IHE43_09115 [Flavobacterium sp. MDT1-60]